MIQGLSCMTGCAIEGVAPKQRQSLIETTTSHGPLCDHTLCLQGEGFEEEER